MLFGAAVLGHYQNLVVVEIMSAQRHTFQLGLSLLHRIKSADVVPDIRVTWQDAAGQDLGIWNYLQDLGTSSHVFWFSEGWNPRQVHIVVKRLVQLSPIPQAIVLVVRGISRIFIGLGFIFHCKINVAMVGSGSKKSAVFLSYGSYYFVIL